MRRLWSAAAVLSLCAALVSAVVAQEQSQAAKTTWKKLQQKITIDVKEYGTKVFLEQEVNGELKQPLKFIIDNASGVSNNSKMSFKAKDITVEKLLNELADKYDWGWFVVSNAANNKVDGHIMIRKSSKGKERGYEAGKEPKK
jgi:hypothetical protein